MTLYFSSFLAAAWVPSSLLLPLVPPLMPPTLSRDDKRFSSPDLMLALLRCVIIFI